MAEKIKYEQALAQVGQMGRYQVYLFILAVVSSSNAGIHLFNVVFTVGMPQYRCAVPGLQNDTFDIQDDTHAKLTEASIPFDSGKGSYSRCTRYKSSLDLDHNSTRQMQNATSFETESCTRWVYSTRVFASSIVSELNLVCDRQIYITHANMIGMAGIMVTTMITGALSDRLIPESPKWLLSRKRDLEAKSVLQTVAKFNGKSLQGEIYLFESTKGFNHKSKGVLRGVILLFKSPILAIRLLILTVAWFVNAMVYYGVSLNLGVVIPGDIYLNFFVITMSVIIVLPLASTYLIYRGRKLAIVPCMVLGGCCCIATVFPIFSNGADVSWVTTGLSYLGKLLLTNSFNTIWLYSTELLPTEARLSGLGFCNFFGRIGSVISPYIATLPTVVEGKIGKALPLLVFGVCGLVSGMLCLLLPETGNGKLPDTVREAEQLET
ncbi:solute carrier family 22 member 13 [Elysia marginata]|uniref:Solute carrier family 22 member 13 n=1 Tax=Elysia marginata TaxID=1093978 RepID=A0AAV4GGM4_9GAST|nr:solute carrier family 22 member 13 [Elysia marginata]